MKGRNPLVILLVVLMISAAVFLIYQSFNDAGITTVGDGIEKTENKVNTDPSDVYTDKLPTEFKTVLGDIQAINNEIDTLKDTVSVLRSENKIKDATILSLKKGVEEATDGSGDRRKIPEPETDDPVDLSKPVKTGKPDVQKLLGSLVSSAPLPTVATVGSKNKEPVGPDEIVWIKPMDAGFVSDKKRTRAWGGNTATSASNSLTGYESKSESGLLDEVGSKTKNQLGLESGKDPRWTIPYGSVITDSLSVTAFVGRIPVNGQLQDPWHFKLSTGRDILMPNGHSVQGLEKTIVEGTAIGDLGLRCVTGRIETMTFVFTDGRIVTHHAKNKKDGIGYITDEHANPCIAGELITNAPEIIAQMSALGIGQGMAQGIADGETQTITTSEGSTIQTVVGSHLKNAGYEGVAQGIADVQKWFSQRLGQYFDVIYVPAGKLVDIHITEEIKIDYDPMGRMIEYGTNSDAMHGFMD